MSLGRVVAPRSGRARIAALAICFSAAAPVAASGQDSSVGGDSFEWGLGVLEAEMAAEAVRPSPEGRGASAPNGGRESAAEARGDPAAASLFDGAEAVHDGGGVSVTLSRPGEIGGSFEAWMSEAARRDAAGAVERGPFKPLDLPGAAAAGTMVFEGRGEARLTGYVGAELGRGHGALCRTDAADPDDARLMKVFAAGAKLCGALLAQTAEKVGSALAESGSAAAPRRSARTEPAPPTPRTAPGQGLKPSDIHAVYR